MYFWVRTWAYLKSYSEARNLKANKSSAAKRSELHGKDSIRKALMSAIAIFNDLFSIAKFSYRVPVSNLMFFKLKRNLCHVK